MRNRFYEGQDNIKAIWWNVSESCTIGKSNVEKITVSMESGQMARVHWFCIWKSREVVIKHNGAMIETVEFKGGQR